LPQLSEAGHERRAGSAARTLESAGTAKQAADSSRGPAEPPATQPQCRHRPRRSTHSTRMWPVCRSRHRQTRPARRSVALTRRRQRSGCSASVRTRQLPAAELQQMTRPRSSQPASQAMVSRGQVSRDPPVGRRAGGSQPARLRRRLQIWTWSGTSKRSRLDGGSLIMSRESRRVPHHKRIRVWPLVGCRTTDSSLTWPLPPSQQCSRPS